MLSALQDGEQLRHQIIWTEKGAQNAALNVYLRVLKYMTNYILFITQNILQNTFTINSKKIHPFHYIKYT